MSELLDDIIKLAVDGKQPLPDILRKCLLLGHELKNERLKAWANQELNGYRSVMDVPDYRIIPAMAKGNFVGPFHAEYRNYPIPSVSLEENHRDLGERVHLVQSVSAYADVLRDPKSTKSGLVFDWDPNMVVYYQNKLMRGGFILLIAWQTIPASAVAEMLDTIRNRTLNMALQIKDELGTTYKDFAKNTSKEAETKIQRPIFQNTGGNTNVAFGQSTLDASTQGQTIIEIGDRKALDNALRKAGLDDSDLDGLTEAMRVDGAKPGRNVGQWVKDKSAKVLSGGIKVGTQIGSEILTAWLKQHHGL